MDSHFVAGGGVTCVVGIGTLVVPLPPPLKSIRFWRFGINDLKLKKLVLIVCDIGGLLSITLDTSGRVIVDMKKLDIVADEVVVPVVLVCGDIVAANGLLTTCAEAGSVHANAKMLPAANANLRTIHLPSPRQIGSAP